MLFAGESNTFVVGWWRCGDPYSDTGTRRVLRRTRSSVVRLYHFHTLTFTCDHSVILVLYWNI